MQKTGLSSHTVRDYLKEDMFPFIRRDASGTRLFSEDNLETFYIIQYMKRCGMAIREIRQYMVWLEEGNQNINHCLELFRKRQQVLEEEWRILEECTDAMEYKV